MLKVVGVQQEPLTELNDQKRLVASKAKKNINKEIVAFTIFVEIEPPLFWPSLIARSIELYFEVQYLAQGYTIYMLLTCLLLNLVKQLLEIPFITLNNNLLLEKLDLPN